MTFKVGVVGAGNMARMHAGILQHDSRVEIAGVTDIVPAKAESLAATLKTRVLPDVESLLDSGVDALYVTTPNTQHVPATLAALARNVHVFCEKPMATSFEQAGQVLQAAQSGRAVYQVGHNRRFAPAYRYIKDQIELGFRPYLVNAKQNDGDWYNPPWITDLTLTGGFLYESSVHLLDMLRWLLGDVVAVQARAKANVYDVLNDFAILLTHRNDCLSVFSSSAHASWGFPFEHLEIVGEHAFLRTEELTRVTHAPGLQREIAIHDYVQLPKEIQWGYQEEDRLFVSACLGECPPAVDALEAYRSIELCQACYQSAAQDGATIRLPLASPAEVTS